MVYYYVVGLEIRKQKVIVSKLMEY